MLHAGVKLSDVVVHLDDEGASQSSNDANPKSKSTSQIREISVSNSSTLDKFALVSPIRIQSGSDSGTLVDNQRSYAQLSALAGLRGKFSSTDNVQDRHSIGSSDSPEGTFVSAKDDDGEGEGDEGSISGATEFASVTSLPTSIHSHYSDREKDILKSREQSKLCDQDVPFEGAYVNISTAEKGSVSSSSKSTKPTPSTESSASALLSVNEDALIGAAKMATLDMPVDAANVADSASGAVRSKKVGLTHTVSADSLLGSWQSDGVASGLSQPEGTPELMFDVFFTKPKVTPLKPNALSESELNNETLELPQMAASIPKNGLYREEYIDVKLKGSPKGVGLDHARSGTFGPSVFVNKTRLAQTLQAHVGAIYTMAFSPDGSFLATGGEDTKLIIWAIGQQQYRPTVDDDGSAYSSSNPSSRPTSGTYSSYSGGNVDSQRSRSRTSSADVFATRSVSGAGSDEGTTLSSSGTPYRTESGTRGSHHNDASSDGSEVHSDTCSEGTMGETEHVPHLTAGTHTTSSTRLNSEKTHSIKDEKTQKGRMPSRLETIDRNVIIYPEPCRIYTSGHTEPILDMVWSKSNFLLTASSDQTVCLWHASQNERLQFFTHHDIVTSVDFHPIHDRYFVSGSFDGKVRLWDVISGTVADFILTRSGGQPDSGKITCVKFSPDGTKLVAGFFGGKVASYYCISRQDRYELKYATEFLCRDSSGRFKDGAKVTGLSFVKTTKALLETLAARTSHGSGAGIRQAYSGLSSEAALGASVGNKGQESYMLLVTTNDNNVRLLDWTEKTTYCKYKGSVNTDLQIRANFSSDQHYIISGTEEGDVVIWDIAGGHEKRDCLQFGKRMFSRRRELARTRSNGTYARWHSTAGNKQTIRPPVTVAAFAPGTAVINLLSSAEDMYLSTIGSDGFGSSSTTTLSASVETLPRERRRSSAGSMTGLDATIDAPLYLFTDEVHFASLLVAAADYAGNIRIYVRHLERS